MVPYLYLQVLAPVNIAYFLGNGGKILIKFIGFQKLPPARIKKNFANSAVNVVSCPLIGPPSPPHLFDEQRRSQQPRCFECFRWSSL